MLYDGGAAVVSIDREGAGLHLVQDDGRQAAEITFFGSESVNVGTWERRRPGLATAAASRSSRRTRTSS